MKARKGDTVKVEYTGKLEDGTPFDRSKEGQPLQFTVGGGAIIPGVDKAIEGMDVGESKTVAVAPEEGYGARDEELVRRLEKNTLPPGFAPEVGMIVTLDLLNGETIAATIIDITEKDIVLDLNHPLAGKKLSFDLKVVDIAPQKVIV